MARRRIPLWLKLGWTLWLAVWAPIYWTAYGPQNFLWFCDLANFAIGAALWLESPLLFSMQALSVLLVQVLWSVDFLGRLLLDRRLLGATEYMLDPAIPLHVRLLSLFHLATPPLLAWAIARLGYDRRALALQTAAGWAVLAISFLGFGPGFDLNWVFGPYEREQRWMGAGAWFAACLAGYPLLLWLPTHLALSRWARPARRRDPQMEAPAGTTSPTLPN